MSPLASKSQISQPATRLKEIHERAQQKQMAPARRPLSASTQTRAGKDQPYAPAKDFEKAMTILKQTSAWLLHPSRKSWRRKETSIEKPRAAVTFSHESARERVALEIPLCLFRDIAARTHADANGASQFGNRNKVMKVLAEFDGTEATETLLSLSDFACAEH